MNSQAAIDLPGQSASTEIRVRGRVQGVGFRPTVWRLAHELGLAGEVLNDADGVVIRVTGADAAVARLIERLGTEAPPLARIESVQARPIARAFSGGFRIAQTLGGVPGTQVTPDAAICSDCTQEISDPGQRRYRYPFANCTHCGPRLSIVTGIPYDRAATTMAKFDLCQSCRVEYRDPSNRRFNAEAIACPTCGPQARLISLNGRPIEVPARDACEAAGALLLQGCIVAIKGLGGYQLACDAMNAVAVARLRAAKVRESKPFALMARDITIIRRYCRPNEEELRQLTGPAAPIVLMRVTGPEFLPDAVAPGLCSLGFMLPTTPLHVLVLGFVDRPVVMTSGNLSGEPQLTDDEEALRRFSGVADCMLLHDRKIAGRVDDSVVRVRGDVAHLLRRARGYAPAPIRLPQEFEAAPDLLALGGEIKSTFCLLRKGEVISSQHQGDLRNAMAFEDFQRNVALYTDLFQHAPTVLAADLHPEYLSVKLARRWARERSLTLIEVQHHHAHVAACLAENGRPLSAPPVLGIVLDGIGLGADGTLWGGEFLMADYRAAVRLGAFKPVPMLGGAQAAREPWRNLYAHLMAEMGWAEFAMNFGELEVFRYLSGKPRAILDAMTTKAISAPPASSCGRLFEAVAAALDICRDHQGYEGEAAARLEALVDEDVMNSEGDELAYPFAIPRLRGSDLPYIEPLAMWRAVLGDLILRTPAPMMAMRFHKGLARAIAAMSLNLAGQPGAERRFDTIALSGGCFQNDILFEQTSRRLEAEGFSVLSHRQVPANDGGLALGQAAIAAARVLTGHAG
jgi:hydrogenase maturation protein HypF